MRAARASAAKHHAIEKTRIHSTEATTSSFALKEKGIFTDTSRAMVRNMVATLDVPIRSVNATINAVAEALGVEITGSVSGHSIRRIVAEGGVAAEAQLVDEMNIAKGVTLSGDATSHKNINYQSHHVTYSLPDGHAATRFAGILHEVNHKSETQLQGWKSRIEDMYDTYNDVVGGTAGALDVRDFPSKVKGMLTDHAEDQKKLVRLFTEWKRSCEREVRGERALATLPPDDVIHLLWEMTESLVNEAGGIDGWDRLGVDEQQRCYSNAHHNLLAQLGQEQFDSLPQSEKDDIDFFVWAGCCMHKELNAAKGGNSRMRAWWIDNSVEGPVLLMNKDNVAASSAGSSTAKQRAIQVSTGGAQKVLELAGAVFRHKDDKKGQQDSLRYYFEVELGYRIQWPDTSNTRYHSHGDAACEYLVNDTLYLTFLELVPLKKESRTSTNIEYNVYRGFTCLKTKQEMMSWATYNQCITHPYLRTIRNSTANILDLGPIHMKVISHLNHIVNDINLILAPDATYETLTLDGKPFERPEAFYAIQRLALDRKTYPHFPQLLVAFFQGALDTWIRFSAEFAAGGAIDKSSPSQRQMAHMKTTNDDNEGALGTIRTSLRRAPHMSLSHFNSRFMYKKNQTNTYIENVLDVSSRQKLRKKARERDESGEERKRRFAQVEYDKEVVRQHREQDFKKRARRDAAGAKLDAVIPRLTLEDITKLRTPEIDLQIRWHRRFDPAVPAAKHIPTTKQKKVEVLLEAVGRYLSGEATPGGHPTSSQPQALDNNAVTSHLLELGDGEDEAEDE
ncbi:hypothetical protein DEU56DRAFT_739092 [Suillus clintonianus]|uniref:uncharacterized protein n=1 Tax=Suillus clintonianus TaxID=1904413 RepID=UPI001B87E694|nr:uncharacterized protein DEU56DRAFT_739092 [Suillus clintonianus]KAG2133325.1 hypothetical protein DEU56DRAFT_739092 [Suillus clintonianus]